jgi:hypothetical protein
MSSREPRADRLAQVESQVGYHGQRLALYRRLHGATNSGRIRELEDAYRSAQDRLARCVAAPATSEHVHDQR